jgi:hypothetical protein
MFYGVLHRIRNYERIHRQQGDIISLILLFQNRETRLKIEGETHTHSKVIS